MCVCRRASGGSLAHMHTSARAGVHASVCEVRRCDFGKHTARSKP